MVKVTAESKGYGTSTPGVLRPSERRNVTRYLLIVTAFTALGVVRMSFMTKRIVTCPASLKMVGLSSTIVRTSDCSVPEKVPTLPDAPDAPVSDSMTRDTGDRSWRTTSPHPAAAPARHTVHPSSNTLIDFALTATSPT